MNTNSTIDQTNELLDNWDKTFALLYGGYSLKHLNTFVKNVCEFFGVPPIPVQLGTSTKEKKTSIIKIIISEEDSNKKLHYILHQLSHYIQFYCDPNCETGEHGPVFTRIAVDIYVKYVLDHEQDIFKQIRDHDLMERIVKERVFEGLNIQIAGKDEYPLPNNEVIEELNKRIKAIVNIL
jgi:hypothetical protein